MDQRESRKNRFVTHALCRTCLFLSSLCKYRSWPHSKPFASFNGGGTSKRRAYYRPDTSQPIRGFSDHLKTDFRNQFPDLAWTYMYLICQPCSVKYFVCCFQAVSNPTLSASPFATCLCFWSIH